MRRTYLKHDWELEKKVCSGHEEAVIKQANFECDRVVERRKNDGRQDVDQQKAVERAELCERLQLMDARQRE